MVRRRRSAARAASQTGSSAHAASPDASPRREHPIVVKFNTEAFEKKLTELVVAITEKKNSSQAAAEPHLCRFLRKQANRQGLGDFPEDLSLRYPTIIKEPIYWVAIGLKPSTLSTLLRNDCDVEGPMLLSFRSNLALMSVGDVQNSEVQEVTLLFEKIVASAMLHRESVKDEAIAHQVANLLLPDIRAATRLLSTLERKRLERIHPTLGSMYEKLAEVECNFAERDLNKAIIINKAIGSLNASSARRNGEKDKDAGKKNSCNWCSERLTCSMQEHTKVCEFAQKKKKKK